MNPALKVQLIGALAPAIGVFIGVLIGLSVRKRSGKTQGLLGGSVLVTAVLAGGAAYIVALAMRLVLG